MFSTQNKLDDLRSPGFGRQEPAKGRVIYKGVLPNSYHGREKHFEVRLVTNSSERERTCELINRMYDWRGYGTDHQLNAGVNSSTFAVLIEGDVVGTLTLTVDSGAGLAADETFRDMLDGVRAGAGSSLCELTKFACSPSDDSRYLLASLFHTIFIYGTERHRCTDLFIEVNPRHVRFYETMLGFHKVGELRTNQAVNAPSQLMCLKVADIARYIEEHAGCDSDAASRSLYPFFLSQEEAEEMRLKVRDSFEMAVPAGILAARAEMMRTHQAAGYEGWAFQN